MQETALNRKSHVYNTEESAFGQKERENNSFQQFPTGNFSQMFPITITDDVSTSHAALSARRIHPGIV